MQYKTWEGEVPFFVQTQEDIDRYKDQYGPSPSDYMGAYFTKLAPGVEMCRHTREVPEVLKNNVGGGKLEMRHVEPFRAGLVYHDWYQGRARVGVIWRAVDSGIYYPMAMACLHQFLKGTPYFLGGAAEGVWRVVKLPGGYFSLAAGA